MRCIQWIIAWPGGITAGSQRYIGLSLQVESCNETTVFEFKGHSNRVGPSTINMGCGNSKTTREGTKCCKGAGKAATQKAEDHSNAAGVLEGCNLSSPQRRVPQRSEASAIKTRIECKTARIEQLLLKAEQSQLWDRSKIEVKMVAEIEPSERMQILIVLLIKPSVGIL